MNKKLMIIILSIAVAIGGYFFVTQGISNGWFLKNKASDILKIKVGYMDIGDCLQLYVAQEKGYFKEQGIDPELTVMFGGNDVPKAVESGKLEIGWIGISPTIVRHSEGSDLKLILPGAWEVVPSNIVHKLLVSNNSNIKVPKDIEGKTIAVNEEFDIDRVVLDAWAEKNNVDLKKVNIVFVPFPQMESAMEKGEIDAGIFIEPYVTLTLNDKIATVLDDKPFSTIANDWMLATWIASSNWTKENPEKIKRFSNAILKANKYIISHPIEMPDILVKYTSLTKDLINQIKLPVFREKIRPIDIQPMIDATYKYGYSKNSFDAKDIIMENY